MNSASELSTRPIDHHALRIPQQSGLAPCLYVPIAARSLESIKRYVGEIGKSLTTRGSDKAMLVRTERRTRPDCCLPIWQLEESLVLHQTEEVWVHVDYGAYRKAYLRAFPDIDRDYVIDHVLNRRAARLKGFVYLRLVPVHRAVNSSHGGLAEKWQVDYHRAPEMQARNRASLAAVQYADLSDIVKMINIQGGGSLMQNVNDAQVLVDFPQEGESCQCNDYVPRWTSFSST